MAQRKSPRRKPDEPSYSGSSTGRAQAADVVRFFEGSLRHTKGALAGRPFRLAEWQRRDIIYPTFDTLLPDGRRQYSTVFWESTRKNGKSSVASGFGLVMLFIDGEVGAEVICLASDVDQGRVVFGECKRMVEASPEIREAFKPIIYRDAIEYPETGSVLRVLSADEKGIHGRNPSALILDELHTFTTRRSREFYVGATTAMGARQNPLTLLISSAGWDKTSICYEMHQYAADLRAGRRSDPSFLSVRYGAAEGADWTDRDVWRQANPALSGPDAFLSMEYLENEFRQAQAMPARQNAFRTFFLNQWVGQAERFIDLQVWDAGSGHATPREALDGRQGYLALDLAAVSDFTAAALLLPCRETPDAWDIHLACYLPEATLAGHRHEAMYRRFQEGGWLTLIPGEVTDHRVIEADILRLSRQLTIRSVTVDARFQGQQIAIQLQEQGLDVRDFPQTHAAFAAPMTELERLVKAGKLHHGGNPILRWAIDNLAVDVDSHDDMKPSKSRSAEKIDPVVAVLMALDAGMRQPPAAPPSEPQMFFISNRPGRGGHRTGWR